MEKKKVLFVINTLGHAGAEVAMLELLRQMGEEEVELSVYVLLGQGELVCDLPESVKLCNPTYSKEPVLGEEGQKQLAKKVLAAARTRGALFKNLPYLLYNGFQMLLKGRIQADKLLWRVVSDGADILPDEYDLAVAYLEGGAAYYVADHVRAKKKAAFIHIDYNQAGYTRALDKDCYLKFDRIFTVSEEVKTHFIMAYPECRRKTKVFNNLLNTDRIETLSHEGRGFADGYTGFRILTVGRLVWQKGYDIAVQVMKLLKEDGYPVRWYVMGEGPLRKPLEKQIAQLKLTEDFVLMGKKKNPYPYFAQADLYAHLSRFEGKSIAIQEAQVLGVPVVASDSSGNREQINNGVDGVLCELDPEKIRDEIALLLKRQGLRMAYAGQASGRQMANRDQINLLLEL
jgi:glycosyltransferase involved in cell wall biosynthesis